MLIRFPTYRPLFCLLLLIPFFSVRLTYCLQRDSGGIYIETNSHATNKDKRITYNKQTPFSSHKLYVHMNKRFEPAYPILCSKCSLEPLRLFVSVTTQKYLNQPIPASLRIAQSLRGPPVVA